MVDEVNYLLKGLGVGVVEEDPLVIGPLKPCTEIGAGDGKKKSVTAKFLPSEEKTCISCSIYWKLRI